MKTFTQREAMLFGTLVGLVAMCTLSNCAKAQDIVMAPRIEVGRVDQVIGQATTFTTLRVSSEDGKVRVLSIGTDGTIAFSYTASIDFSGAMARPTAGRKAGYILVYVEGEPRLIPLYHLPTR